MTALPAKLARPRGREAASTVAPTSARGLTERGRAELRFLGMRVYTATLWADPRFDPARFWATPLALAVHYHRALKGELLVERTLVEMRRQADITAEQTTSWSTCLNLAFTDVRVADQLSVRHDGAGSVSFWRDDECSASLQDMDFAHLFLGIWLAPTCAVPAVRRGLLS